MGLLIFTFQIINFLAWPVLALGYPLWASIRAIETGSKSHMRRLVTYWTIFSFISLYEHVFEKLIQWVPLWQYIKLITICWLVIPQFEGACYFYENLIHPCLLVNLHDVITQFYGSCYVYQRLLYLCLSVYLQTVTDWSNKPMDDPSLKNEIFLAMAERYLQENGFDALEKLIANKFKNYSLNNPAEEIKTTDTSDEAGILTPNQVKSVKENLIQIEKKTTGMQVKEMVVPAEVEETKLPEVTSSKQVQTDWSCAPCQLTTTSEYNLESHLNGWEHKANYEGLKTFKQTAKSEGSSPVTTNSIHLNQEQVNHEAAAPSEHNAIEKSKEVVHLAAQQEKPKKKKNDDAAVHNATLWCDTCNVWCPSTVMAAHLNGRKHLAKIKTTMSSAAVAERYLEENGSDALEKLIANKSKDYSLNHHAVEIKTSETSVKAGILTPSQVDSEAGGPVRDDIKIMENMIKHEAAEEKKVKSVKENLIQIEKKTTEMQVKEMLFPSDAVEIKLPEVTSSKQVQTELTCALCQETTTSEHNLKFHNGQKHEAKCEELNTAKSEEDLPVTTKSIQLNQEQLNNEAAAPSEHIANEKFKEVVHLAAQQEKPKQQKNDDAAVHNSTLWCGTCNVWCPCEIVMASHLNGKKHLAKLKKTMSSAAVAERHLEENGSDALEKLIANKSKDYNLNHHAEEIKTSDTSDKAGMLTPSQIQQHVPVREDINAMRLMVKHDAVGPKQVRSVKENLIWVEKKTTGVQVKETALPESREMVQLGATKNAGAGTHDSKLWCYFCNIWCSHEIDLAAHLNGMNHLVNFQETMSSTTRALDYANMQFYQRMI